MDHRNKIWTHTELTGTFKRIGTGRFIQITILSILMIVSLMVITDSGFAQTETPAFIPVLLDYDPDLSQDNVIDASDLLLFLQAWEIRDVAAVRPSPTPAYAQIQGFVTSASTNFGVSGATVIAGTGSVISGVNGHFILDQVRMDTTSIQVARDGFQQQEQLFSIVYPMSLVNVVLYPLGMATPTGSPSPSMTETPALSATITTSPTPTLPGPSRTHTGTLTPTATRTRTSSPTPTVPPLLGLWRGDLMGEVFIGTDLRWNVVEGGNLQALAEIGGSPPLVAFIGTYQLSGNQVTYTGNSFEGDELQLSMTWDGSNTMLNGTFNIQITGNSPDSGSVVNFSRSVR